MSKLKDSSLNYLKYEKKYPRIETPYKLIKPNIKNKNIELHSVENGLTVYYDLENDVYYNKLYTVKENDYYTFEDNNEYERFFILDIFLGQQPKDRSRKRTKLAKIQFIPTLSVGVFPIENLFNGKTPDPYFRNMFNGNCAIGNIKDKYDDYGMWFEIMTRCFDPSYHLYNIFGRCATPLNYRWVIYEYFHIDISYLDYNMGYKLRNPNDQRLYSFYVPERNYSAMSKLPCDMAHCNFVPSGCDEINKTPIRTIRNPLYNYNRPDFSQCLRNIEIEKKTGKKLLCHDVPNDAKFFYGWDEFIT